MTAGSQLNPYAPPVVDSTTRKLTPWGLRSLAKRWHVSAGDFADGKAVIFGGIAFQVDAKEPVSVYVASPSEKTSDDRLDMIVAEAFHMLPVLRNERPDLALLIRGRQIHCRLIDTYAADFKVLRQVALNYYIDASLSVQELTE